mmetsp:Transcript_51369/g.137104  ORF Transcript_51369/g.137104 Transcript_51369/m.137104 type:complete len:215 (-) Transcript_51369:1186-1830(-)
MPASAWRRSAVNFGLPSNSSQFCLRLSTKSIRLVMISKYRSFPEFMLLSGTPANCFSATSDLANLSASWSNFFAMEFVLSRSASRFFFPSAQISKSVKKASGSVSKEATGPNRFGSSSICFSMKSEYTEKAFTLASSRESILAASVPLCNNPTASCICFLTSRTSCSSLCNNSMKLGPFCLVDFLVSLSLAFLRSVPSFGLRFIKNTHNTVRKL